MKAILVMDMPNKCKDCCFCRGFNVCRLKQCLEKDGVLSVFTVDKQILDNSRSDWCPLHEIPKTKNRELNDSEYVCGFTDGYNACIDEILGDRE